MPRPKSLNPGIKKHFSLAPDVVSRMELELFSEAEGRIPMNAQAELINNLLRAHFKALDRARSRADKEAQRVPEPPEAG